MMIRTELFLDVRYYETDQMGIVHHSNYIRFFECGRSDMMKKVGIPVEKMEEAGVLTAIVAVECRYKHPARMGDTLRIVTVMDKTPTAKIVINSEVYNQDGQLCASGGVTIGFLDKNTLRPMRCPEWMIEMFENYKPE